MASSVPMTVLLGRDLRQVPTPGRLCDTRQMTAEIDDAEIRRQVSENLQSKFPHASTDEIDVIVGEEFAVLASSPVRDYIGVLTERAAKRRLRDASAPA